MTHSLNFLEHTEPEPVQHERKRRKFFGKFVVGLIAVLVILLVVQGVAAARAAAHALDGKGAVSRAEAALFELDFETARSELLQAEQEFMDAADAMKWMAPVKILPWAGNQVEVVHGLLEAGATTVTVIADLLEIGEDVVRLAIDTEAMLGELEVDEQVSWSTLESEIKQAILLRLAASASDLELAKLEIDLVLRDLEDLPDDTLAAPLAAVLEPFTEQLLFFDQALDAMVPVAYMLPSMAGLEYEQHVLLLFLNNAEMRPGGGFIGSYGIATLEDAELTEFETHGVMEIDAPAQSFHSETPPEAIRNYLTNDTWYFRDSNWSPDFAVSTENGLRLYHDETSGAPSGTEVLQPYMSFAAVIGLTPTFVSGLLDIVGSITIDDQTFDAENILTTLEYAVEYGFQESGIPFEQRKEIIGDLADVLKERLFDLPVDQWGEVFGVIGDALETKQLVFYSTDPMINEVIARKDWAGRVFPGDADTLMVVDANMASLKTDPAVERAISYSISQDASDRWVGKVDVTYDHQGTFDWKTSRYRTYTRVYVPLGSELISSSGHLANDKLKSPNLEPGTVDVTEELGLTAFGTFTSIEPDETRTLSFEYYLPESVSAAITQGIYQLDLIKQIGAANHNLELNLDFDKKVRSAYPGEEPDQFGDEVYNLNTKLDQNIKFVVEF